MRTTLLLAAALLVAGCVNPGEAESEPLTPANATPADAAPSPAPATPANGSLRAIAVFADRTPLAGVEVSIGEMTRLTDASGIARFASLPPGKHTLIARKAAHRTAQQEVTIEPGVQRDVEIVLAAEEGGQHAHQPGFATHQDRYTFEGHFDCSATYVIITGDCLILAENVTHTAGVPDPTVDVTSERNLIEFPLDVNWSTLIVEMTWDQGSAPAADGMTLALEPAEAPSDGHAAKYARTDGGSPLRVELVPGVHHATATEQDMPNPLGGEVIRARAFLRGSSHHPGGTDFLGVGFASDFKFTLHVSIFYGEPAPGGYTAIR